MKISFDEYSKKARIKPGLIAVLPIGIAILALYPNGVFGWAIIWSLITISGGTLLISEIGRDMGKNKENKLYEVWDGMPSIKMLRHSNNSNSEQLKIRHNKLSRLITDINIPSAKEELQDNRKADEIYGICSTFLRNNTRDIKKFPLIFKELCSYGFRRNLWGLKPIGIVICALGLILIAIKIFLNIENQAIMQPILLIALLIDLIMLFIWIFWVNANWVKIAADAYAERLLESADDL